MTDKYEALARAIRSALVSIEELDIKCGGDGDDGELILDAVLPVVAEFLTSDEAVERAANSIRTTGATIYAPWLPMSKVYRLRAQDALLAALGGSDE